MTQPIEHVRDAQRLDGDAYVNLFEIQFYPSGSMFICPERKVTWQGDEYDIWGLRLTGVSSSSDDETSRPKLSLANFTYTDEGEPVRGVFSAVHAQQALEGSIVIRRRVLKNNLENDVNIKEEKRWRVSRIASETPTVITLELRNTLDGPRFTMPARKFLPPEFAQVTLY